MTLKAYTKGEHVLRFEAVVHNTKALRCGRVLDRFPEIIDRLAGMVDRFATTLDCVDVTFIGDGLLDQLPAPSQIGATRVGGVDVNKPRIRAALSAALALSTAPGGFTVTEFTTKVHTMTGQTDSEYTTRQGAYDLRKLRGKDLITKPGRTRRYQIPAHVAGTIAALLALREHVIAPSWPVSAAHGWDANPPPGPASTATTKPSASTCKPSSTISASPPPGLPRHRQLFVDRDPASVRWLP